MDRRIQYLVIDVDGTMTDGGIYYDDKGNELKKFCVKDAAAFFVARQVGITTIVLTGRECAATARRIEDLEADFLLQNVKDKAKFLQKFMETRNISSERIAYIGDDLNDLPVMKLSGFVACPADSCQEVREIADYISPMRGGHGAVRNIVEHILRETGEWANAVAAIYSVV